MDVLSFWAAGAPTSQPAPARAQGSHPAYDIIRGFEGYRDTPYWDVDAYRTGWGSDTVTMADGSIVPVRQGMTISRADADRDLNRRVDTEFMPSARRAIGDASWSRLTPEQQGVLTSLAYNYGAGAWGGSLSGVVRAVQSGDIGATANAISALGAHNNGINQRRRNEEASIFSGGAYEAYAPAPQAAAQQAPQQAQWQPPYNALAGAAQPSEPQRQNSLASPISAPVRLQATMIDPKSMQVW